MKDWLTQSIKRQSQWSGRLVFSQGSKVIECLGLQHSSQIKKTLDDAISNAEARFKDVAVTTVVELQCPDKSAVIVKRYNARNTQHIFSRALRKSRAMRCWQRSYDFAKAGINVAKPELMFEQRFGPFRLDAYFVSEKLVGQELLSVLPMMSHDEQAEVARQVKSIFEKMRVSKLTHGDLKATNILWVDGQLYFIDLDAAQKHASQITWQHSHQKDRKRFIKNWREYPEILALFTEIE